MTSSDAARPPSGRNVNLALGRDRFNAITLFTLSPDNLATPSPPLTSIHHHDMFYRLC